MDTLLLLLHVIGGTGALLALPVALLARKRRGAHTIAGLVFVAGMAVAVGSALPLAVLVASPFLAAVAVFSAYLIASGWRWIRRPGVGTSAAWGRGMAVAMLVAAVPMTALGIAQQVGGDGLGVVLLVFAAIGGSLAIEDLRALSAERLGKAARTTLHLGRMIGGGIATVTAVLVVNVAFEPAWVVWLAPTAVGVPLIAVWSARLAPKRAASRT